MNDAIQTPKGGWMGLGNYCSVFGPKGQGLRLSTECLTMDEELLAHELGERVVNEILTHFIDGFDALMDAIYAEYCANESARSSEDDPADTTMRDGAAW